MREKRNMALSGIRWLFLPARTFFRTACFFLQSCLSARIDLKSPFPFRPVKEMRMRST